MHQLTLFTPACIDYDSPPGSSAFTLALGAHSIRVLLDPADALNLRLALRKAARLEPDPHRRGHITRAINRSAE